MKWNHLLWFHLWIKFEVIGLIKNYFTHLNFHTSASWWFSTGIWVTVSLLKNPGFFLVFKPILIMLSFRWSLLLWWVYRARQLPLVSQSLSCLIVRLFFSSLTRSRYLFLFRLPSVLPCGQPEQQSLLIGRFSFFFSFFYCWLSQGLIVWPRLGVPFVSQNPKEFCASHFLGRIRVVHIPFVRIVKFKFLAQFPTDHLPCPVVSNLILSWC